MKTRIISLFICLFIIAVYSCSKDQGPIVREDPCDNTNFTYTNDVKPIIDKNCAFSGCHNGANSLTDYSSYPGLFADRAKIQEGLIQGFIDMRATVTQEVKDLLLCWVKDGAPE